MITKEGLSTIRIESERSLAERNAYLEKQIDIELLARLAEQEKRDQQHEKAKTICLEHSSTIIRSIMGNQSYGRNADENLLEAFSVQIQAINPSNSTSLTDRHEVVYWLIIFINRNSEKDCQKMLDEMLDDQYFNGEGVEDFLKSCWLDAKALCRESEFIGVY
jgi:hypothetical protein